MRVLHVLNYGWPSIDGYTVRSAGLVAAQRRHLGVEATVLVSPFAPLPQATDPAFRTPEWNGDAQLRTRAAHEGPPPRWERPALGLAPVSSRALRRALDRAIADLRPDVVHAHHPHYVGGPALEAARRHGIPAVYEVRCFNGDYDLARGGPYFRLRGQWQNALERRVLRAASAVVTISGRLAERVRAAGVPAERVHVVRNSVDTELFRPRPRRAAPGAALRVGYATTFEPIENLDALVHAAGLARDALRSRGRELRVVVAGTGRDRERIRALVDRLGLAGTVELPGFVPYGEMPAFYEGLDLFVVPRRETRVTRDTTPLKPLEALSVGVPVLATELPALRELFGAHPGVRFCAPEPGSIADGILAYAAAPWGGAPAGVPGRSWREEVERYRDVYDACLAEAPRNRTRVQPRARRREPVR